VTAQTTQWAEHQIDEGFIANSSPPLTVAIYRGRVIPNLNTFSPDPAPVLGRGSSAPLGFFGDRLGRF
jgi:hypothetical protein